MPKKSRKHFPPEEKMAQLRRHLIEKVPVSQICQELDIRVTVFYGWLRQLFERGSAVFQQTDRQQEREVAVKERQIAQLQEKLQKKNEVVAELMEEHVQLKKELGEL